jgi:hypothetical protein
LEDIELKCKDAMRLANELDEKKRKGQIEILLIQVLELKQL